MEARKGIREDPRIEKRTSNPGSIALEENPHPDPRIPHEKNPGGSKKSD